MSQSQRTLEVWYYCICKYNCFDPKDFDWFFSLKLNTRLVWKSDNFYFLFQSFEEDSSCVVWFGDVAFLSIFWLKSTYVVLAEERITDNLVSPLKTTLQTNIFSLIFRGVFSHKIRHISIHIIFFLRCAK